MDSAGRGRLAKSGAALLLLGSLAAGSVGAPAAASPVPPASSAISTSARDVSPARAGMFQPTGGKRVVYLTFDDGPSPYTPQILKILRQHGAHATFFMVGYAAASQKARARAVIESGNAIGNHTYGHPALSKLSNPGITSQLRRAQAVFPDGAGGCFRPPYGATNTRVRKTASAAGYKQYMWTVDPRDWSRPGSNAIFNRVAANVRPGSIILLHDGGGGRGGTIAALKRIVPWLKKKGYMMVTLPGCR